MGSRVRLLGVAGSDLDVAGSDLTVAGSGLTAAGLDWLLGPAMPFALLRKVLILVWIHDPGMPSPEYIKLAKILEGRRLFELNAL